MDDSLKQHLLHAVEKLKARIVVIFIGDLSEIEIVTLFVTESLPDTFVTDIDIIPIEESTLYLQKTPHCVAIFTQSCFKYVTPKEFLETHYDWLYSQVIKFCRNHPEIEPDDAFQEIYFYLGKILSKYDNQCNIRTFVGNRIRGYLKHITEKLIRSKLRELKAALDGYTVE